MKFNEYLRSLIKEKIGKGKKVKTIVELCELSDCSEANISNFCTGRTRNPSPQKLAKLSLVLTGNKYTLMKKLIDLETENEKR